MKAAHWDTARAMPATAVATGDWYEWRMKTPPVLYVMVWTRLPCRLLEPQVERLADLVRVCPELSGLVPLFERGTLLEVALTGQDPEGPYWQWVGQPHTHLDGS